MVLNRKGAENAEAAVIPRIFRENPRGIHKYQWIALEFSAKIQAMTVL